MEATVERPPDYASIPNHIPARTRLGQAALSHSKGKARALDEDVADSTLALERTEATSTLTAVSPESSRKRRQNPMQDMQNIRRSIQRIADLPHKMISKGKLAKARALWYNVSHDFCQLTFSDNRARRLANHVLHELVALHLPYSLSDKIAKLLVRFEETTDMQDAFIGPYNMLVKSYAQQVNVDGAVATLERMKELGLRVPSLLPDERTYSHIVTMYAHRREPEAAHAAFEELLAMGLEPTQPTFTSLMNAHVEAGQWKQALAIFEHLDKHPDGHPLKPDAQTCTTLIKCYTLMGASTADVLAVYASMVRRSLRPTPRTFGLLLQSACDGGMMEFAEEIFTKMDTLPVQNHGRKREMKEEGGLANQFTFTIMIRGFVRAGNQAAAKEYYDEMIRRGIEPTSSTWSTLIGAYADARVNDPRADHIIQGLLNEFLRNYVEDEEQPDSHNEQVVDLESAQQVQTLRTRRYKTDKSVARATALHSVYGPVISAYGKVAGKVADGDDVSTNSGALDNAQQAALRVLDRFQEMHTLPGAKPSIHIYTTLLDAYRRANDLDRVQEVWNGLFRLAIDSSERVMPKRAAQEAQSEDYGRTPSVLSASQRNLLCLPLSIYIDALSSNHLHDQVADVWIQVQAAGFGFDAGNWNHLTVALLRAGEISRAFWTVETILLQPPPKSPEQSVLKQLEAPGEGRSDGPEASGADEEEHQQNPAEVEARAAKVDVPIRPPNRSHEVLLQDRAELRAADTVPRLPDEHSLSTIARRPDPEEMGPSRSEREQAEMEEVEELDSYFQTVQQAPVLPLTPSPPPVVPLATSPPLEDTATSLTSNFERIAARRHAHVWTVHAATLKAMEGALLRLRRLAEGDPREGTSARAERQQAQAREELSNVYASFPRSLQAIEEFRRKTNLAASRR